MTDITPPPPHLLKKFSEQARASSQKRGAPNYLKTFAILCIEWAMNSQSTPNDRQIRNSDITPPPELVSKWCYEDGEEIKSSPRWFYSVCAKAAQWGADQELEACCKVLEVSDRNAREFLYAALRPKPPSLKEEALGGLDQLAVRLTEAGVAVDLDTIRRALEALPDA